MKFPVISGNEFEVTDVEVIRAHRDFLEQKSKNFIVVLVFLTGIAFLAGSGVLGIVEGSFEKLSAVWMAVSAPLSGILGYYFRIKESESSDGE